VFAPVALSATAKFSGSDSGFNGCGMGVGAFGAAQ